MAVMGSMDENLEVNRGTPWKKCSVANAIHGIDCDRSQIMDIIDLEFKDDSEELNT